MKSFFEKISKFFLKNKNNLFFWMVLIIIFVFINLYSSSVLIEMASKEPAVITYNEFKTMVENKEIEFVEIDLKKDKFLAVDFSENAYETDNPKLDTFKSYLLENDVKVKEIEPSTSSEGSVFGFLRLLLTVGLLFVIMRQMTPKVETKKLSNKKVDITFENIAGHNELKKDLGFIVEFLKDPSKMKKANARMPKGVVLYGPPGTGKTLFAKAIAGSAGVPFFSASGSDFVEMFVGLGAKRIRGLFEEARKNAPCIIFIDEIDAVGSKRGGFSNSEKDQTINALLTELDGFKSSEGIITICATNRVEDLDPALIRAGRFDKQIAVNLPDRDDRLKIIKLYAKDKNFSEDVDFEDLANSTSGFSGADIENLLNEAALITATKNKEIINNEAIETAFFRIVMKGDKKENQSSRDKEELKLVAWHEAGHTLVARLLAKDEVSKVTILASTSGAGGVTFRNPPKTNLHSREYLEHLVQVMYAGRAAEEIMFGDKSKITTGASSDIQQATGLIKQYISHFGMSDEFGMINIEEFSSNNSMISAGVSEKVLNYASKMSNDLYEETLEFLNKNKDLLENLADALLEKETLKSSEIDEILKINKKEI